MMVFVAVLLCAMSFLQKRSKPGNKINSIFKYLTSFKTPAYSILQMKLRRSITEA